MATIDNFNNMMRQALLGSTIFKSNYMVHKSMANDNLSIEVGKRHIVNDLSTHIVNHFNKEVKERHVELGTEVSLDLLVLRFDDFKELVEAGIQTMPQEAIDRIRNGENVLQNYKKS